MPTDVINAERAYHDLAIAVDLAVVDADTAHLILARAQAYARCVALGHDWSESERRADNPRVHREVRAIRSQLAAAIEAYVPDPHGRERISQQAIALSDALARLNILAMDSMVDSQWAQVDRWCYQRHADRHDRTCWTRGQLDRDGHQYHADPLACECFQQLDALMQLHVAHGGRLVRGDQEQT